MLAERNPYPGLRSFERDDIDVFFGRDECIDGMLARLRDTQFLAVLGASGTGKSSLVKTGLLSALGMGLIGGAGSRWRVVVVRPGDEPLRNLARVLVASVLGASGETGPEPCKSATAVEALRGQLAGRGAEAVVAWCRAELAEEENLLIVADQFEQLFKSRGSRAQDEAEFFATLLLESARAVEGGIFVTITMRSEYLGPCALIEGLAEAIAAGMYLVPRMSREQCRQAIEGPAKVFGGSVAEPLVNALLNDLARLAPWDEGGDEDQLDRLARRADQLPLLQFALNRMWVAAAARAGEGPVVIELADYEALGGLKGALNNSAEKILKIWASGGGSWCRRSSPRSPRARRSPMPPRIRSTTRSWLRSAAPRSARCARWSTRFARVAAISCFRASAPMMPEKRRRSSRTRASRSRTRA